MRYLFALIAWVAILGPCGAQPRQDIGAAFAGAPAATTPPGAGDLLFTYQGGVDKKLPISTVPTWFDTVFCNTIGYLVVRTTGGWVCSKAVAANPVWWGADPTGASDSAPAFNSALAASDYVKFPPGLFEFNSNVSFSLPSNGGKRIECSGMEVTTLFWLAGLNGISVNYPTPAGNSFSFSECTLATRSTSGSSVGLSLSTATAPGAIGGQTNLTHLAFRGADGYSQTMFWNAAIEASNISNINASGVNIAGIGCTLANNKGSGILATGTAPYAILNITYSQFACLIEAVSYGTYLQGMAITQSNMTSVNYGVQVEPGGLMLSQLTMSDSQIACFVACINEQTLVGATVLTGNVFIPTVSAAAAGVILANTGPAFAQIVGNQFNCDASPAFGVITEASEALVAANMFTNCAQGITLNAGSNNNSIQANRFYMNASPIVNDVSNTGNVITGNPGYNPVAPSSGTYGTASTVTYTGHAYAEVHYLTGGTVTAVKIPNNSGTTICTATPCTVTLPPNGTMSVTYSGAPTDTVSPQ